MSVCPECKNATPANCRLPYVCACTKAILTTKNEWLIPRVKQMQSDFRKTAMIRSHDLQQRKEEKGRQLWKAIHLHTECNRDWYADWREQLVKSKCNCGAHFRELERTHLISFESEQAFFESSIAMHNAVNDRLSKPQMSLEEAYMLWRHRRPDTGRKRCIVTVAVGYEMLAIHRMTKPINKAYADRCDADFICLTNQLEPWWGLEKFRTWHFAKEYEECLFLDADAIVSPDAPVLFGLDADVAMHDDYPRLPRTDWLQKERSAISRRTGEQIVQGQAMLNSGVVFTKQSAADIWKRPLEDIGTTHCAEQIWLEHQIDQAVTSGALFRKLDDKWNWQWWFGKHNEGAFEAGLADAYIVHFANAPNRLKLIGDYINTL